MESSVGDVRNVLLHFAAIAQERAGEPDIIFDSEGGIFFPANAVLPREAVKEAAMEYCRTSTLPSTLAWQPSYWC